jgi:hypothetical protein
MNPLNSLASQRAPDTTNERDASEPLLGCQAQIEVPLQGVRAEWKFFRNGQGLSVQPVQNSNEIRGNTTESWHGVVWP